MAGVSLQFQLTELAEVQKFLNDLGSFDREQLLDEVGAELESQTRRRIAEEKETPEGDAWAEWSPDYQKTRHSGHSLLMNEGDLLDSIQYNLLGAAAVEVGSNLVYAAAQHFGFKGNLGREYLGLSADNRQDIDLIVADFMRSHLEAIQ